jgi:hypothetical protein
MNDLLAARRLCGDGRGAFVGRRFGVDVIVTIASASGTEGALRQLVRLPFGQTLDSPSM